MTRLINLLSWLPGHSGFGSYVQRVLPQLEGLRLQLGANGQGRLVESNQWTTDSPPWAPGRSMRFLQRYSLVQHGLDLPMLLQRHGLTADQLEGIYSPFFDALLMWPDVPQLITCHDLTPLVASNSRKAWLRYRFWQPRHCRTATRLIAISRYVADQLVDFGVEADRIEVIPNGICIQRSPVESPASEDLLALARHDVNKNVPALLRGIAQLQRQYPNWQGVLRIVGRAGRQSTLVRRMHRDLPRSEQVQLINALPQAQLIELMRSSLVVLSASTEEGFDYPVLEAKAEGLPTLVSDIPVHREFHDGSSMFFPVDDDGMVMATHIINLLNDNVLWKDLSKKGVELARILNLQAQINNIENQFNHVCG